ncbi:MAG: DUF58 domain-containing protein [Alphaproteobacteria bacterium]|nr:DUF58 domain-containing protein [Alphaproteobacteria bacterium]
MSLSDALDGLRRAARPAGSSAELLAEAEAAGAGVAPLTAAAERIAATVALGFHGRRRAGVGETFWQFRPFDEGDGLTDVDWRQSAATDSLYVREQEWEAQQTVLVWPDESPSMSYRSSPGVPTKAARARLCALAVAFLLVRGGERIGLVGVHGAGGTGRVGVQAMAERLASGSGAPPGLPRLADLPHAACVVLFSDFLYEAREIAGLVDAIGTAGARAHLVQVLDPAEESWPFAGRTELVGLAREERLLLGRAEAVKAAYAQRLEAHRHAIRDLARKADVTFLHHRTDERPERLMMALAAALPASHTGPHRWPAP